MSGPGPTPTASPMDTLSDSTLKDFRQTLRHLIDHIAQRIEYAESRRSAIAAFGGVVIAAGIATLGLIKDTRAQFLVVLFWTLGLSFIALGGLILWVYSRQTNFDYPFKNVATTRKWFYWYALQDPRAFSASWSGGLSDAARQKGTEAYNLGWQTFKNQVPDMADERRDAMQDLEQVYLLHVNERYKNLFLTDLRKILSQGLIIVVLLGVVVATLAVVVFPESNKPSSTTPPAQSTVTTRAVTTTAVTTTAATTSPTT
jgi:hypothetical protein